MSKELYQQIGESIRLERLPTGAFVAHVDQESLDKLRTSPAPFSTITKESAIELFNETCSMNGAKHLFDPSGYMVPENNAYQALKDTYIDKYETALGQMDQGMMHGSPYAMEAVLDKINSVVRKDISPHLPKGMKYGDLRFTKQTPELQTIMDKFVGKRVALTQSHSIRRSVEATTIENIVSLMNRHGDEFKAELVRDENVLTM